MKKLKHIKTFPDTFRVERKVHRHIPLTVRIQKELQPHPLYWRLVDPKFNLIEIGLEDFTGRLVSITVTNYNGPVFPLPTIRESAPTRNAEGVPGFDVSLWQTKSDPHDVSADFYDVTSRGRLQLAELALRVELFPDPIFYHVVANHNFVCEFNEASELCAVRVTKLTPDEVEVLTESLIR
jgi:hypothetical protein